MKGHVKGGLIGAAIMAFFIFNFVIAPDLPLNPESTGWLIILIPLFLFMMLVAYGIGAFIGSRSNKEKPKRKTRKH